MFFNNNLKHGLLYIAEPIEKLGCKYMRIRKYELEVSDNFLYCLFKLYRR